MIFQSQPQRYQKKKQICKRQLWKKLGFGFLWCIYICMYFMSIFMYGSIYVHAEIIGQHWKSFSAIFCAVV